MSKGIIFTVDADGALNAMRPSAPRDEDFMQQLVARYPELIADHDGRLLLIRREQPIADKEDGGGRWSVDHLFVTRSGVPVLVELKRAKDTRLRREVVGQMLDYAANGTAYWRAGKVAQSFASTATEQGADADELLAEFLDGASGPEDFWEQVDANFAAGRVKMVFVADEIPSELARIIEFLNEQMRADVRGVELGWFESDTGVTALAPRIIGETERAQSSKANRSDLSPISREEWIAQNVAADDQAAAFHFIEVVAEAGGHAEVTRAQGSLIAVFDDGDRTLFPMKMTKNGVQLCLQYIRSYPGFEDEEARAELYRNLEAAVGPLSSDSLTGYPGFSFNRLADEDVRARVAGVLRQLVKVSGEAAKNAGGR